MTQSEDKRLTMTACLADDREDFLFQLQKGVDPYETARLIRGELEKLFDMCYPQEDPDRTRGQALLQVACLGADLVTTQRTDKEEKAKKKFSGRLLFRRLLLFALGLLLLWGSLTMLTSPFGGMSPDTSPVMQVFLIGGLLCFFFAGYVRPSDCLPPRAKDGRVRTDPTACYARLLAITEYMDKTLDKEGKEK